MQVSKPEIRERFNCWLLSWNEHDLEAVMDFMHENIYFENWNGTHVSGKQNLKQAWQRWFQNHGNFKFSTEDLFIDEQEQKIAFSWKLEWPSPEKKFAGEPEVRRGIDILKLENGKIRQKITYSKTLLRINDSPIILIAE